MTKHLVITFGILFFTLISLSLQANNATREINHLINFVSTSECVFVRNGSEYSGSEAAEHMEKKYRYFSSKIDSAERFIELSASKSTFSGKPYYIRFGSEPKEESQIWLLNELARYRKAENSKIDSNA